MPSNSSSQPPTIGLGVLSWRAHKTLLASLETYHNGNLFSLFDETLIFFQEIEPKDRAIAEQFGLAAAGSTTNLGIMGGMKKIAELLNTDYVLHLENDLPLIASNEIARRQIAAAVKNMKSGNAKLYRMDERKPPTVGIGELRKYLRYHPAPLLNQTDSFSRRLWRFLRPVKARRLIGDAVYADAHPHLRFPHYIKKISGGHWAVNSAAMNWSNRASLYPRRWFLDEIIPYAEANPSSRTVNGKQDLEKELNRRWWRNRGYRIGVCDRGLFIHERFDRPQNDEKGR